ASSNVTQYLPKHTPGVTVARRKLEKVACEPPAQWDTLPCSNFSRPAMKSVNRGYLPTLDGWRAIAILAVLLDHATLGAWDEAHSRLLALTRTGANGVSLFFDISGFLICSRLIEEEQLTGGI